MQENNRVLIVGAGPVGLILAIMLRLKGISCHIIDKRPEPTDALRSLLISKETENIFSSIGIMQTIRAKALSVACMKIQHYELGDMQLSYKNTKLKYPCFYHIYQPDIESILTSRLKELGMKINRNTELIQYCETENNIQATLKTAEGEQKKTYCYIIGCDGVNSKVGMLANIEYSEESYIKSFILADILVKQGNKITETHWYINKHGYTAIIPATNDRIRVIQSIEPYDEDKKISIELLQKTITEHTSQHIEIIKIEWQARSRFRHKTALKAHQGRIFLAGDAFHIFSPIGGVNMNFGISDAKCLAHYLSLVIQEKQSDSILKKYETERMTAIKNILQYTKLLTKIMLTPKKYSRLWGIFFLEYRSNSSFIKKLMLQISGLSENLY